MFFENLRWKTQRRFTCRFLLSIRPFVRTSFPYNDNYVSIDFIQNVSVHNLCNCSHFLAMLVCLRMQLQKQSSCICTSRVTGEAVFIGSSIRYNTACSKAIILLWFISVKRCYVCVYGLEPFGYLNNSCPFLFLFLFCDSI